MLLLDILATIGAFTVMGFVALVSIGVIFAVQVDRRRAATVKQYERREPVRRPALRVVNGGRAR
jgi:hypothetical protein